MPFGNIKCAIGVMEQPRANAHNLFKRIVSALVLIPPVLAAIYYGHPFFDFLILIGFAVLLHEWLGLCGERHTGPIAWIVYGAGGASVIVTALVSAVWGGWILMAGFMAVILFRIGFLKKFSASEHVVLLAFGFLYFCGAIFFLLILRQDSAVGMNVILFLFLVAWAADTGAYFFGRLIGGPKMAPVLSPNKTWAGLIGGVICGAGIGAGFFVVLDKTELAPLIVAGGALGIVSQGGDLLESYMKRRFQVKDAGNLIPGHGGLLDRVDSLLALSWVSGLAYWAARDKVLLWM